MAKGRWSGKRVVLGVCGGIAAYKAVEICRRLIDGGATVVPVLTRGRDSVRRAADLQRPCVGARTGSLFEGSGGWGSSVPHIDLAETRRRRRRRASDGALRRQLRGRDLV